MINDPPLTFKIYLSLSVIVYKNKQVSTGNIKPFFNISVKYFLNIIVMDIKAWEFGVPLMENFIPDSMVGDAIATKHD